MKRSMLASVLVLVLCGIVSAYESNVSWVHGEIDLYPPSIVPDNPTNEDLIHFSMPTDIYANQWVAERDMGGTPTLSIDPEDKTIKLRIQGPPPGGPIPTLWDPVCGLEGYFGPLEDGRWLFDCYLPSAGVIWRAWIDVGLWPELYDYGESYRSFSPQTVEGGQQFEISCDIRNGGETDSGPFTVRFYASVDTDITADDTRIGEVSILNIRAGDYADCDWSGDFPTDIPPGQYYVGWIIDADDEVDESDETNNNAYKEGYKLTVNGDPPITVKSPNGGESMRRGTSYTITWSYSGNPGSYVKIELYKGGVLNRTVSSSTANDGSYNWSIPSSQTTGSDYKVKITSTSNSSYYDYSDNNFSITEPPSVTVTSPNGGESWQRGTSHNITWNSSGNVGAQVKLQLYKGGEFNYTMIHSTSNNGSYTWYIPPTQTVGSDYKIKITSISNSSHNDYSDNSFSITEQPITVSSPNGGENWQRGTSHNITWNSSGNVGAQVKLQLYKGGEFIRTIDRFTLTDDKSFNWYIPPTQTVGSDYKIKITSISNSSHYDYSNDNFFISEGPCIIYVDDDAPGADDGLSWESAYRYLQDALTVASSGCEIRVAQGIYKPDKGVGITPGDREATFQLKNGVSIKGGYAGFGYPDPNTRDITVYETILSGDLNGNDLDELLRAENSCHVVVASNLDETSVLDGFTITGGNADAPVSDYSSSFRTGAGMYNDNSSPTVINCTFSGNAAHNWGGGMYNYYSNPILTNCTFSGNSAYIGGGMNNYKSNPTLTNCTFSMNSAVSDGGGMYNSKSNPTLTNCTFAGNSAQNGNALACDMYGNEYQSNVKLSNCILWDGSDEICCKHSTTMEVAYSNIQGGLPGVGNINTDPMFVRNPDDGGDGWGDNPATPYVDEGANDDFGDLHLLPGSPCVDSGDNMAVPRDTNDLDGDGDLSERIPFDLDGNPRFVDDPLAPDTGVADPPKYPEIVDMGAYEFAEPDSGSLSEALDTTLSFTTGSSAKWFGQNATSYYGGDAAQSGDISHSEDSWMQTTVGVPAGGQGFALVFFYWKVSSDRDDYLQFYVDGSLKEQISESVDWQLATYTVVGPGLHTLEWRYVKDYIRSEGQDCGWVDWLQVDIY